MPRMSVRALKIACNSNGFDSMERTPSSGSAKPRNAPADAPAALGVRSFEEARNAVVVVGFAGAATLSLPALLLLAAPQQDDEACGWTSQSLSLYGMGSAACLWFSIVVAAAQAFVLSGVFGPGRGAALARRLGWHLALPALGLLAGGGLGAYGLSGLAALATDLCGSGGPAHALPAGAVSAGYLCAFLYLLTPLVPTTSTCGRQPKVHPDCYKPAEDQQGDGGSAAAGGKGGGGGGGPEAAEKDSGGSGSSSGVCAAISSCSTATPGLARESTSSSLGGSRRGSRVSHRDSRQPAFCSEEVAEQQAPREGDAGGRPLSILPTATLHPVTLGLSGIPAARRRSSTKSNASRVSFSGGGTLAARRRSSTKSSQSFGAVPRSTRSSLKGAPDAVIRLVSPNPEAISPGSSSFKVEEYLSSVFADRRTSIRSIVEEEEQSRRSSVTSEGDHGAPPAGSQAEEKAPPPPKERFAPVPHKSPSGLHGLPENLATIIENRTISDCSSTADFDSSHVLTRLDKPTIFCGTNPINFDKLSRQRYDSSSSDDEDTGEDEEASDEDEGSAEEVWCPRGGGQIEVPIWLMDKLKQKGETLAGHVDHPGPLTSGGAAANGNGGGQFGDAAQPCSGVIGEKRVSFMDQEMGVPFHKYSQEKTGAFSVANPSSAFWKIPMPTRKNSIHIPSGKRPEGDIGGGFDSGGAASSSGFNSPLDFTDLTANVPPPPLPVASRRQSRMLRKRNSVAQQDGGRSRRASVLGIFSEGGRGEEGLYAIPKEPTAGEPGTTGEIVEVTTSSLVMSSSMMEQILNSKSLGRDDHDQAGVGSGEGGDVEVVLPFFAPLKKDYMRQCHCEKDPITGHVIHTCMTPNTTHGNCTAVDQSYVCSAWQSKHGTQAVGSRRISEEAETRRKRIRNASVLAIGGGPVPNSKQEDDEAEEQEEGNENELMISFCSIQLSRNNSQRGSTASFMSSAASDAHAEQHSETPESGCAEWSSQKGGKVGRGSGETEVENELGQRFDLVEPQELGAMLKDAEVREQLLVVDVRGRDWVGGHIPSSINLRTSEVLQNPGSLLAQCRQNRIHTVVFTCMYSVLRARKCATAIERVQVEEQKAGWHAPYRIRLQLLQGGMHAWVNHYMGPYVGCSQQMPEHLVDFDPAMWSDGGPSQGGLVHVMDALWSSGGQKALSDALTQELFSLQASRETNSPQESSRRSSEGEVHGEVQ